MMPFIVIFIIGLFIGAFIDCLVLRGKSQHKDLLDSNKCFDCIRNFKFPESLPLIGHILKRGTCKNCHSFLSLQRPLVELNTALLFVLVMQRYFVEYSLPAIYEPSLLWVFIIRDCLFVTLLMVLFLYDFRFLKLPASIMIPGIIIAFILNLWVGVDPYNMFIGALFGGGFFLAQYLFSKGKWIGLGDVHFGVLIGVMLGAHEAIAAIITAYILGAIVGIILLIRKKRMLKSQLPFGMFLAYSALIVLFAGTVICDWFKLMV